VLSGEAKPFLGTYGVLKSLPTLLVGENLWRGLSAMASLSNGAASIPAGLASCSSLFRFHHKLREQFVIGIFIIVATGATISRVTGTARCVGIPLLLFLRWVNVLIITDCSCTNLCSYGLGGGALFSHIERHSRFFAKDFRHLEIGKPILQMGV